MTIHILGIVAIWWWWDKTTITNIKTNGLLNGVIFKNNDECTELQVFYGTLILKMRATATFLPINKHVISLFRCCRIIVLYIMCRHCLYGLDGRFWYKFPDLPRSLGWTPSLILLLIYSLSFLSHSLVWPFD